VAEPESFDDIELLTVSETAARLRVSKMTVYRMVHAGELPAVRIGRGFRIHRQDLTEFLRAAHQAGAPAHQAGAPPRPDPASGPCGGSTAPRPPARPE
jgi:excisionase family DNA binding protein